jgi:TRAP-type mannitol/chloroaromatic compound transport system permease small subunit
VRFLSGFNRGFGAVAMASNALASAWIFVMMFIVVADIFMRYVFNAPIDGTIEIIQASIIAVLYLQLAYTLRSGRLTRSDAFYNRMLARHPKVGQVVGLVFHAAGLVFMLAVMWPAWPRWLNAYRAGDFEGVPAVFTFPRWPAFLVLFIGCALMAIQFALLMIDNILALAGKPPLEKLRSEHAPPTTEGVV